MSNAADYMTRLERNLRFILSHPLTVEGKFATVDELNTTVHSALRSLEQMKLDTQSASGPEPGFEVLASHGPKAADLADAAPPVAPRLRRVEKVRGFAI
jgi:hypothetical protein